MRALITLSPAQFCISTAPDVKKRIIEIVEDAGGIIVDEMVDCAVRVHDGGFEGAYLLHALVICLR